jgi:hypothetical protein
MSLNDESENLMILPPIDESISDKIILLHTIKSEMPMAAETADERRVFWDKLVAELPAYLHFLENWKVPLRLRDSRYGVAAWHHPDIMASLDALAPEIRMLNIVDHSIFGSDTSLTQWDGTAEELEERLTDYSPLSREAQRLLNWSSACGVYLGRLAAKKPERVQQKTRTGKRRGGWIVFRDPDDPAKPKTRDAESQIAQGKQMKREAETPEPTTPLSQREKAWAAEKALEEAKQVVKEKRKAAKREWGLVPREPGVVVDEKGFVVTASNPCGEGSARLQQEILQAML